MKELPVITILTPCYNHGIYIKETIQSIHLYKWTIPIEHIIINDGSTDEDTIQILKDLKAQGQIVIDQKNGGPSSARNAGLKAARGKYILPLDSDNKINPVVFEKAYKIMEKDQEISVVYTDYEYFGEKSGIRKVGKLNELSLLIKNQLDTCALIRTTDLIELGGYDENMPYRGNEDWELWLKMIFNDKQFFYLEAIGYQYRSLNDSLSQTVSGPNRGENQKYLINKYESFYATYAIKAINKIQYYEKRQVNIKQNKIKNIIKIIFNKPLF